MTCRKCAAPLPDAAIFCHLCGVKQTVQKRKVSKRANGTGTAVKRPGQNTWTLYVVMGYDPETKRAIRRSKGGFTSKTAALEYVPILKGLPDEKPKTLAEYHALWKKKSEVAKSKQTAYRIAWKKMEPIHHTLIGALTIGILQEIVDKAAPTHYPARDMRTLLSHMLKLAVADGQARVNLAEFIKIPSLDEKEGEPFNSDEINEFWTAYEAGNRMCGYILLMIYTGMMPGELLKLRKGMIDLTTREIKGVGLKTKERKKKPMVLPLIVLPVVEDLMAESSKDKLFPDSRDDFYEQYNKTIQALNVRQLPPYSCRHTTGTALALGNQVAPSIVQRVMRHTRFSTTQKYIHPDTKDAISAVDAVFAVSNDDNHDDNGAGFEGPREDS